MCRVDERKLINGVGKCSVPMWCNGIPAGFCDDAAYGERPPCAVYRDRYGEERRRDGRYNGYVPSLACPGHGGPDKPVIIYEMDGDMWCAHFTDFTNLQESPAGFGETKELAKKDLEEHVK